jgi:hypothetical protein
MVKPIKIQLTAVQEWYLIKQKFMFRDNFVIPLTELIILLTMSAPQINLTPQSLLLMQWRGHAQIIIKRNTMILILIAQKNQQRGLFSEIISIVTAQITLTGLSITIALLQILQEN